MKPRLLILAAFASFQVLAYSDDNGGESAVQKVVVTEALELMRGRDSNAFSAYSTIRKAWDAHRFPYYLTIKPWTRGEFGERAADAVIAFQLSDGPIEQLIAVDTKGRFRSFKLDAPVRQEMCPELNGESVIYYIADGVVYAFSGRTGTWDTLKAPHLPEVQWVMIRLPLGPGERSPYQRRWRDFLVLTSNVA